MNRLHAKYRIRASITTGLFILSLTTAWAGPALLTSADIEKTMAIREKADALRLERLILASSAKSGDESFPEVMTKVQRIGHEADKQACDEFGITVPVYRDDLRRLIKVGELVFLEDVKSGMEEELRYRQAKTEADLIREAEETRASTELWFDEIQGSSATAEAGDQDKPAVSSDYADSLEQIVMEPLRQQAADGVLVDTVRQANEERMEEIRQQLVNLNRELSAPPLRQAVLDKPAVLDLLDKETLLGLSSSLVEDLPE